MTDQPEKTAATATTNRLLIILIIVIIIGGCCLCSVTPFGVRMIDAFLTGYYRGLEEGTALLTYYI